MYNRGMKVKVPQRCLLEHSVILYIPPSRAYEVPLWSWLLWWRWIRPADIYNPEIICCEEAGRSRDCQSVPSMQLSSCQHRSCSPPQSVLPCSGVRPAALHGPCLSVCLSVCLSTCLSVWTLSITRGLYVSSPTVQEARASDLLKLASSVHLERGSFTFLSPFSVRTELETLIGLK